MNNEQQKKSVFSTNLLKLYYDRLFPYREMYKWLCYGNDSEKIKDNPLIENDYFLKKEFSFTIENDIYIRYLSFKNQKEMMENIKKYNPHKIDIGALYNCPAKDHKSVKNFKPIERELVFDIDLDDYQEVRLGCKPTDMWENQSWLYMSCAVKVIDRCLREDFGYKHILWVFSGRRGKKKFYNLIIFFYLYIINIKNYYI